jgi:hypothetical protein
MDIPVRQFQDDAEMRAFPRGPGLQRGEGRTCDSNQAKSAAPVAKETASNEGKKQHSNPGRAHKLKPRAGGTARG